MDKQQKIESIMALLNGMKPREANDILSECEDLATSCIAIDMTGLEMPCLDGVHPRVADKLLHHILTTTKVMYKKDIAWALNEDAKDLDATADGVARRMLDCIRQVCPPSSEK